MPTTKAAGTTSEDYSLQYFSHLSDSDEDYLWESPGWQGFFLGVARRTLAATGPAHRTLDVGCAKGFLVMAFLQQGCDAWGFDIAEAAIADAPEPVQQRVRVASSTEPFDGQFDLITCIEVLEHLSPEDAEVTIDNLCVATDRVVLSSTPHDFDEPTHINVHPLADWVAAFAARGFFRRTDVDMSFLTPWAVYFERATLTPRDVVHRYETLLYPLRLEVGVKRDALLEASRTIARMEADQELPTDAAGRPLTAALQQAEERIRVLEHDLLRLRDHAIACEAIVGTARLERDRAVHEAEVAREELQAVRASERWRLGGALLYPVAAVKRRVSS
jgi:hypothetical protein